MNTTEHKKPTIKFVQGQVMISLWDNKESPPSVAISKHYTDKRGISHYTRIRYKEDLKKLYDLIPSVLKYIEENND